MIEDIVHREKVITQFTARVAEIWLWKCLSRTQSVYGRYGLRGMLCKIIMKFGDALKSKILK